MKQQDYKIIESIDDLSQAKFEDCLCDQKLSVLIIDGKPDDIALIECWSNLYAQYLDILGDAETLYLFSLEKEVHLLNYKIEITESIIKVLELFFVGELVQALKEFGFPVKDLTMGNPSFAHGLKKITNKLAYLKLKLTERKTELKQYSDDEAESTVTRQKMQLQRARLSKFQGYPIKPAKTMVPEYVAYLKEYLSQPKFHKDGIEQEG